MLTRRKFYLSAHTHTHTEASKGHMLISCELYLQGRKDNRSAQLTQKRKCSLLPLSLSLSASFAMSLKHTHTRAHTHSNRTNICILGLSWTPVCKHTELAFCRTAQLMFSRLRLPQGQVSHSLHPHPTQHHPHHLPFSITATPTRLTRLPTPTTSAALMGLQEHKDRQWCIHFLQMSVPHLQTAPTQRWNWPSSQACSNTTTTLGCQPLTTCLPISHSNTRCPLTHPLISSHNYQSLLLASWHPLDLARHPRQHPVYMTNHACEC